MVEKKEIRGIACSIFQKEIEILIAQERITIPFEFIDSELHMKPLELKDVLKRKLKPQCLVCYGKCEPNLDQSPDNNNIIKTEGLNCVEIILGKELYRKLRRDGNFFLMPEWTLKWERIFKELLGLSDQALARQFMNEMHSNMLYVNTGIVPLPYETLKNISEYFDINVDVLNIDLTSLESTINKALNQKTNDD